MARLLDAGLSAFAELGFHSTSIDEICARAHLARGTFYSHFESKDALFFALFEQHMTQELNRIAEAVELAGTVEEAILGAAGAATAQPDVERRWFIISTEFTMYAARNSQAAQLLTKHEDAVRARLRATLARFVDESSIDTDLAVRFIVALYDGAMLQDVVGTDLAVTSRMLSQVLPLTLQLFEQH
ncbi:TetR/AcrR family transcriptional regulator [Gordonia sp. CPCC 205333]|uniref:TetR/AcrR family transcriptional regulator n=1 Tax=Gordonia sp. CPCC 205333 TaxID=3140790 RepID=UPI003AF3D6B4